MALTAKQQRFVEEYLIDCNATQAAIRAGYSAKTAYAIGDENLKKPEVSRALAERRAELTAKTEITQEYVLNGLRDVGQRCMQREPVMVFNPIDKCMEQAIDEETGQGIWKFDSQGANRALELLGKHLGMFSDKFTGDLTINVVRKDRTLEGGAESE